MDPRDVHIPSPCEADWSAMRPDEGGRSRHCQQCQTRVHDLSAMTEREAEVFLRATAGHAVCLSFLETSAGERLFADSPRRRASADVVPLQRLTRPPRGPQRSGFAAPIVKTAFAGALAACTPHSEPEALVIDDEPETALVQAASYDAPTIPSSGRYDPPLGSETPCDPQTDAVDESDEDQAPPHVERPPRIHRTAGIPVRKTGGPLGGL